MSVMFSDAFEVSPEVIKEYGSIDISLDCDVPVFIDPFRLYASEKPEYQALHASIAAYLKFLLTLKVVNGSIEPGLLKEYFCFREFNNIHMGYSIVRGRGRGLGMKSAQALCDNLSEVINDCGNKRITRTCHIEKLSIIRDGIGSDFISDFTANIIKDFLLKYTQEFAKKYISPNRCEIRTISRAIFKEAKKVWTESDYYLPIYRNIPVVLVPKDILTRDDTWINRGDLVSSLSALPDAIDDDALRGKINLFLSEMLDKTLKLTQEERHAKQLAFFRENPEVVSWYLKHKEDTKLDSIPALTSRIDEFDAARSNITVGLMEFMKARGDHCMVAPTTYLEAREKAEHFKHAMEDYDVYKVLYPHGQKCFTEETINHMFRLLWFRTGSDVSFESDNGRGPVDLKVSRGAYDKCLVEFKLGSNTKLKQNLANQLDVYKKAHDIIYAIVIIIYTDDKELRRINTVLSELGLDGNKDIFIVDARPKLSASNVK